MKRKWGERGVLNPIRKQSYCAVHSQQFAQKSSVLEYLTIPAFPVVSQVETQSCSAQMVRGNLDGRAVDDWGWHGEARPGEARQGAARLGVAWHGSFTTGGLR